MAAQQVTKREGSGMLKVYDEMDVQPQAQPEALWRNAFVTFSFSFFIFIFDTFPISFRMERVPTSSVRAGSAALFMRLRGRGSGASPAEL